MKLGIHHPSAFSSRWIAYCEKNAVEYKIVNALDNDIVNQLKGCDALMWHYSHIDYRHKLAAKSILFALEHAGIKVFPDSNTAWHFDDKVGQKYLLEAIKAPLVPSYVFYDKKTAKDWINTTSFPKVFKLRGGAGAANVSLVKNKEAAIKKTNKAFDRGFSQFNRVEYIKERFNRMRNGKEDLLGVVKAIGRLFITTEYAKMAGREKGYVYFQDFIPDNNYDIRIIVIGSRAFAIKRGVRKDDFRASGSGNIIYDKNEIDERCIEVAFEVNKKIKSQSTAFDFIFNEKKEPLIVEISYGYAVNSYDACPGYWEEDLTWYEGSFNPQAWMVEAFLEDK